VVEAVVERAQRENPGVAIAGWRDGYWSPDEESPEPPPEPLDPPPHAAATRRVTSSIARRRFIGAVPFVAVLAA